VKVASAILATGTFCAESSTICARRQVTTDPLPLRTIRRYERATPCELAHVDIKKLGNIPDGGGHKIHGPALGNCHRQAHRDPSRPRRQTDRPNLGYSYLHNAVDDHSRLTYTEILPDETKESAVAFWSRARAFFTDIGITVQRVITDNSSCYRSKLWRQSLADAGITRKRTRPYRPQTNGKVERFNRTLMDERAYAHLYTSERQRRDALAGWLHTYNHHRAHTAPKGQPPASRIPNLSGQCT
jgi:hypothetical protein